MRYAVVIEKARKNYTGYIPDLPGCVATGKTIEETKRLLREAIELHTESLRENGEDVPAPETTVHYVEAPVSEPVVN